MFDGTCILGSRGKLLEGGGGGIAQKSLNEGIKMNGESAMKRGPSTEEMKRNFADPPISCRPHTRWWWMGNAITKEDLTWQLEQMHEKGIGGVEQVTMEPVYEKGNVPYLSEEHLDLLVHAVGEARKRGMEFSLNFGGPGWVIGGAWVKPADRSKNMVPTAVRLSGGRRYSGELPTRVGEVPRTGDLPARDVGPEDRLLAVVAAKLVDGRLEESSLVDLTSKVKGRSLRWYVPRGEWQLMAFWLMHTGQGHAIDHFDKKAMERYCEFLGGTFRKAFGREFGRTVESLFIDSFEVDLLHNGIYWSDGLLAGFREFKGYDLTRYLPAIWWDVGTITPKIRYDVNEYLHHVGLDAFFRTFLDWCEKNRVKGRIQPYGFATDILQGAGMAHIPEMEITAGEKDSVPWFDTRIGPKKYVASGARLYGRNVVSVEAYTYIHWETYRATLEELKIASDDFLRNGANKFYNHGYTCSPERDIAPSRRFESEVLISHTNVWWKYHRLLSDYVARCCYLLRQGRPMADVAVYLPLANQWTLDVRNPRRWTRNFDWGSLGKLLMANGYDFDLVNDDVLLKHARMEDGVIRVRDLEYRILLLPNIRSMPLETLERVRDWVHGGGAAVALERVPESSVGLRDYERKDAAVRAIAQEMFDLPSWRVNETARRDYGRGTTYHIRHVIDRQDVLEWHASALDPFLNVLRRHVGPDLGIDFVKEGIRENEGLSFIHRRLADKEIYFVTNIQDRAIDMLVSFRVAGKAPSEWNPHTGEVGWIPEYEERNGVTWIPLRMRPYESTFIVFGEPPGLARHVTGTSFSRVLNVDDREIEALATHNGVHTVRLDDGALLRKVVTGIPQPYAIDGEWQLELEGVGFQRVVLALPRLTSLTDDPRTKHFSGTARYQIEFRMPSDYLADGLRLELDPGLVGNIAEVELNGRHVGVSWMRGQGLDVTGLVKAGCNLLAIDVTNTLINRVSGLKDLPPVPEHLRARYGNDLRARTSGSRRLIGYEPLPNSGLLGPVLIKAARRVAIPLARQS